MNTQSKFKITEDAVRIGGKGGRKHKRVPNSAPLVARRLQDTLDELSLIQMSGIDRLTFVMDDRSELVISMPSVQGSTSRNLFVVSGKPTHVPSPSPPPPPPPPPSPAFGNKKSSAKKPKKPRNRIRLRNKCVQKMLLAGAGDCGADNGLGSATRMPQKKESVELQSGSEGTPEKEEEEDQVESEKNGLKTPDKEEDYEKGEDKELLEN